MGESVRSPHFFKIILQDTIRSGKLVVPKRFVRKYGTDLPRIGVVLLKVPTGDTWDVELRRGDGGAVWMQKGWLDFASFYSIRYGHFLVFQHVPRGSNVFNVTVFDMTATEIEYPVRSRVTLTPVDVEDTDEENNSSLRATANKMDKKINTRGFQLKPELFVSEHPFFQVVMPKSYISRWTLTIPAGFTRQHIDIKRKEHIATLEAGDLSWPTKVVISRPRSRKATFSSGFGAFVKGNSLKVGDLCTFELIQREREAMVFRVSIQRNG